MSQKEFKVVQRLIYEFAGIALAETKRLMATSRLTKRLRATGVSSFTDYLQIVEAGKDPQEKTAFINALTTNKTDFFRESHHFEFLVKEVFPALIRKANNSSDRRLRIWCSASSTGEEPYTIAMTVREFLPFSDWDVRILASDIDTNVLAAAQQGVYQADRIEEVPKSLRQKYFNRGANNSWVANDSLKEIITFRQINLLDRDWPIRTTFDVIFCRNVMIYFDQPTQKSLVAQFHKFLANNGFLIIGHSESLLASQDLFRSIGNTIYAPLSNSEKPGSKPISAAGTTSIETTTAISKTDKITGSSGNVTKTPSRQIVGLKSRSNGPFVCPSNENRVPIIVGEYYASQDPEWVTTLLGSCVAVCLYDDAAKVGGMNHFMLPNPSQTGSRCASFGINAMELLINSIIRKGGDRRRLKAKVFGRGNVIKSMSSPTIGERNVEFALKFLETDQIPVEASYVGGLSGMNVQFHTHTQKVRVRLLNESEVKVQAGRELEYYATSKQRDNVPSVTLF